MNLDYRLNSLLFDLHNNSELREKYKTDRLGIYRDYNLTDSASCALSGNDVSFLFERVNPFLLRYYFIIIGYDDKSFIESLRNIRTKG